MNWTEAIDAYCERTDPSFWAEPINAVTNLAFVVAGLLMWRRCAGLPLTGRILAAVLVAIGIGSFLFHTFAQPWAGLADVLPILAFIVIYIFAANRDFWGFSLLPALLLTLLFVPYAVLTVPLFQRLPFLSISAEYWPVPLLIGVYAWLLWRRQPATARGLAAGAGILTVSLVVRSLDGPLCMAVPLGTHFLWHLLNAVMLGWMIEVWRRALTGR